MSQSRNNGKQMYKKRDARAKLLFCQYQTYSLFAILLMLPRELKQQRGRQVRKRHLKNEFALPSFLWRLFHLVQFIKYGHIFFGVEL